MTGSRTKQSSEMDHEAWFLPNGHKNAYPSSSLRGGLSGASMPVSAVTFGGEEANGSSATRKQEQKEQRCRVVRAIVFVAVLLAGAGVGVFFCLKAALTMTSSE
ncbi:unnamed protein product [Cylindrotheca closterium]|uniref:Transmembrane protein n=1 Tax=Cylindrotheca closterium TaxID=2856 RepID=A0AAD2FPE8_9STRA|nr:unnamed protein product [Cylindrotheca closterium]